MAGTRGLLSLTRVEVPPGEVRTVTTRTDVSVTLWVERGIVAQVSGLGKDGQVLAILDGPGAVPIAPGEVHLRNDDAKVRAVVFAAMAELEVAARDAPTGARWVSAMPESKLAEFDFGDGDVARGLASYKAFCVTENNKPLTEWTSRARADAAAAKHAEDTDHDTTVKQRLP